MPWVSAERTLRFRYRRMMNLALAGGVAVVLFAVQCAALGR